MFEAVETGHRLSTDAFERRVPALRTQLIHAQHALADSGRSVVVVVEGIDGPGRARLLARFLEWLDPRGVAVHAFGRTSTDDDDHPEYWRYWRRLPRAGQVGIFLRAWPTRTLHAADERRDAAIARHRAFERAIATDHVILLKYWLHLSQDGLRQRIDELESDPATAWQVNERDRRLLADFDAMRDRFGRLISATDSSEAPWTLVDSLDANHRAATVMTHWVERVSAVIDGTANGDPRHGARASDVDAPDLAAPRDLAALDAIDLSATLASDGFEARMGELRPRLHALGQAMYEQGRSTVLVLEGWDAAGKGGVIRRLVRCLDPRDVRVHSIGAPVGEEREHHFLWRFWQRLPADGRTAIFDRSWYGRVLVERVEGFASEAEWRRAYGEINDFEAQLLDHGTILVKCWLHIDRATQAERFRRRKRTPWKRFKYTDEDERNRSRWSEYEEAIEAMVERTSTIDAPWTLVAANSKRHARVTVLETVAERWERALGAVSAGVDP